MRICRVATVPFFLLHHLKRQIVATIENGHEVWMVASDGVGWAELEEISGAHSAKIEIPRKISPLADLRALWALYFFFRRHRFDLVHSATPKAGLLCAIAGLLAGVPLRLHTFTGQPWAELKGPYRWLVKTADWLIVRLNTCCYADSESQRQFLIAQGVARPNQVMTLGPGSLAGVDAEKFKPGISGNGVQFKNSLSIPANAHVITFIGRVTKDKGISELISAFDTLPGKCHQDVYLLLVGPFEPELDPLPAAVVERINAHPNIRVIGYVESPVQYLAITDIFCLPSYREGFGNVVIEAAAMGIPAVATRIVGLVDSVADGVTGVLVPPKNHVALAEALSVLLNDATLRQRMGMAARERATSLFDMAIINQCLLKEYAELEQAKLAVKMPRL